MSEVVRGPYQPRGKKTDALDVIKSPGKDLGMGKIEKKIGGKRSGPDEERRSGTLKAIARWRTPNRFGLTAVRVAIGRKGRGEKSEGET